MNKPVIIIGAGGHAKVLISVLKALGREIIGVLDPNKAIGQTVDGIYILGDDNQVRNYTPDSIELVNGLGSVSLPVMRKKIYMKFKNDGYTFASIIHPSAIMAENVHINEGAQIMAGAIVQTGCAISFNAIINTGAIVDHGCIIGQHAHIAPGAVLSGDVKIGDMSHIGTGATIIQGIKIGCNVIVGAGAVVIHNAQDSSIVMGHPAKAIRSI